MFIKRMESPEEGLSILFFNAKELPEDQTVLCFLCVACNESILFYLLSSCIERAAALATCGLGSFWASANNADKSSL